MSRRVTQPVGQKRLTNVAVVRLRKQGHRFEIACFKNKVLSWRARVEKDIDEVLQTHTVFSNVSKGVLAKSTDLIQVFGTDDEDKVCLEILEKGELQVADKEREAQLSSQFRDIATIVMDKTVNPETERPYTITMIERLMREIHFAVDPHKSSKQQALELIRELQKQFPISRAHMKLRLVVPLIQSQSLLTTLDSWNARVEAKDEMNGVTSVMCQVEPGHFRECDALVRKLNGRLEVVSMAVQREGEGGVDTFNDDNDYNSAQASLAVEELQTQGLRDLTVSSSSTSSSNPVNLDPTETERARASFTSKASKEVVSAGIGAGVKQQTCNTCNSEVGDTKQYREHFKSDWHKHNLKRKMKGLPPLSPDECLADTDIVESVNDLNEYSR